jgi:hypothetical protein
VILLKLERKWRVMREKETKVSIRRRDPSCWSVSTLSTRRCCSCKRSKKTTHPNWGRMKNSNVLGMDDDDQGDQSYVVCTTTTC